MTGEEVAATVRANLVRLLPSEPLERRTLAARLWPNLGEETADRRLRRLLDGQWPTADTLARLCSALEVDASAIYSGSTGSTTGANVTTARSVERSLV
jgi:hypothetical protein